MGAESRRDSASLKDELFEHPGRFEFFQAVRLLRMLRPDGLEVGADDPADEPVRFRSDLSLAFPAAEVANIEPPTETEPSAVLSVPFLGVASPASFGSLPTRYTQQILEEEQAKNRAPREFLDLFNHRIVSLFFRAWEKQRLDAQHESGERKYFERALFGLIGMETPGLRNRIGLDDAALLSRSGLLGRKPLPATCLEGLLGSYFDLPVEVAQFRAAWYALERDEQNRLGRANTTLGHDLVVGERVQMCQFKFRVRIGPLDWAQYQDFFPDAGGFRALDSLVRLSVTPELDFETQLSLRGEEVPTLRLEASLDHACRLGWSTWLGRRDPGQDADDALLHHSDVPLAPPAAHAL